jgi:dolichyl-phosphate-mannose-protein mannosyltransferase
MPIAQRVNRPVVALLAVAAIAGGIRFWALSRPPSLVFDEIYYPKAACILVGWSNKTCLINSSDERYWRANKWDVGSWVHPPLGKWEIALGIKTFGMWPFGWRVTTALAGTLAVVLTASIAQLLFGSPLWTFVTGLLLGVESLNVVMSRTALLDAHLELWVVAGFLFLVLDRRWIDRRSPDPDETSEPREPISPGDVDPLEPPTPVPVRIASPIWRPWRFAAGAAFGAAASVKWSGAMAIPGAALITYAWETSRRVRAGVSGGRAFLRAVARESFGMALAFGIVPVVVYGAVWVPWLHHFGWDLGTWWKDQQAAWAYQVNLRSTAFDAKTHRFTPTHPYYSRPWTWLLMLRPVNMYAQYPAGQVQQVLAIGNPAVFWGSFWTLPFSAYAWRRLRDWRAGFALVAALALYLPWFVVRRPQFFFYVLPVTPFLVLAAVFTLRWLSDATWIVRDPESGLTVESSRHPYRPLAWAYVLLAVGLFVWFYPVLTAQTLTSHAHHIRLWFQHWV